MPYLTWKAHSLRLPTCNLKGCVVAGDTHEQVKEGVSAGLEVWLIRTVHQLAH